MKKNTLLKIIAITITILIALTSCSKPIDEAQPEQNLPNNSVETPSDDNPTEQEQPIDNNEEETPKVIHKTEEEIEAIRKEIMERVDNITPADELIKNTYSIDDVFGQRGFAYHTSYLVFSYFMLAEEVDETCKIECLREMGAGEGRFKGKRYYAVFNIREGGRVYAFFEESEDSAGVLDFSHSIYVSQFDEAKFQQLKKGDAFTKLSGIDSAMPSILEEGEAGPNYIGWGDTVKTFHFSENAMYLALWKTRTGDVETTKPKDLFLDRYFRFDNHIIPALTQSGYPAETAYGFDYNILPQDYIN